MADINCPDCGRPMSKSLAHWFGDHKSGTCGNFRDEADGDDEEGYNIALANCSAHTLTRLRSQLATAEAKLMEAERENERLDAALFEANGRRLQTEASGFHLAALTIDALTSPPCECKGTGTTVGPDGFRLCDRCAAEKEARKIHDAQLSAANELNAKLEREVTAWQLLVAWAHRGHSRGLDYVNDEVLLVKNDAVFHIGKTATESATDLGLLAAYDRTRAELPEGK